jgi:hypothetical protein
MTFLPQTPSCRRTVATLARLVAFLCCASQAADFTISQTTEEADKWTGKQFSTWEQLPSLELKAWGRHNTNYGEMYFTNRQLYFRLLPDGGGNSTLCPETCTELHTFGTTTAPWCYSDNDPQRPTPSYEPKRGPNCPFGMAELLKLETVGGTWVGDGTSEWRNLVKDELPLKENWDTGSE